MLYPKGKVNKVSSKYSFSISWGIFLIILFFLLFSNLTSNISFAESSGYWIAKAENAMIIDKSYSVERETAIYRSNNLTFEELTETVVDTTTSKRGSDRLFYTKKKGLRLKSPKNLQNQTLSSAQPSPFTLDVSHMLLKMKGKATWVLENENTQLGNQECVLLKSSGANWLVRLWIKKDNGAILRYDQYLNNQFIGSSIFEYGRPMNRKYLPTASITLFRLTGHKFVQKYSNYFFQ